MLKFVEQCDQLNCFMHWLNLTKACMYWFIGILKESTNLIFDIGVNISCYTNLSVFKAYFVFSSNCDVIHIANLQIC